MDARQKRFSILMFPWLAHGHISPFLELAKNLTNRNFYIYFCSTAVNLDALKPKISAEHSLCIEFVELHLPSLPELPPRYHTTNGLPPQLMNTLKKALDMSAPAFAKILETLNPDLLVYDFLQHWAPKLASLQNIPAVHLMCFSAVMTSFMFHAIKKPREEFPFPEICLRDFEKPKFRNMLDNCAGDFSDKDRILQSFERSSNIVLIKTLRELEGEYMDYLSVLVNKKIVPTGALVQNPPIEEEETTQVLEWLSKKTEASTVFVSFGSEYFLSKEQREEIAYGLELSQVNFIWVVRFPVGEKMELQEALPRGFLQRIGETERGMVVEGWAPQARILQHSSIGGFVSHCGWSSVVESIKFGVPIIALPMQFDQPLNARLVDKIGVGLEARRNEDGSLKREEIAKVIKEVVAEKDGEIVRRKAEYMSNPIGKKGEEDMDDQLVEELINLCELKPNSA